MRFERMNEVERRSLPVFALLAAVCLVAFAESACGVPLNAADRPNPYKYERPDWGRGIPGNDRDVRAEALSSLCRVLAWNPDRSTVILAECRDAYSGKTEVRAGRAWSLDHVLPAARAWHSRTWRNVRGGICRHADKCREFQGFFDYKENLLPTSLLANEQKSDKGPAEFCPANPSILPELARTWRAVAERWRIELTPADLSGLTAWDLGACLPRAHNRMRPGGKVSGHSAESNPGPLREGAVAEENPSTENESSEAETWRDVPGWEGLYQVSDIGNVRSLDRLTSAGRLVKGRLLRAATNRDGYAHVGLRKNDRGGMLKVHRLVLLAFVGPPPLGTECCHKNGHPSDNRRENLRWGTPAENAIDKVLHGTMARGARSGHAILSEADARLLLAARSAGFSAKSLARLFGVQAQTVRHLWIGHNWRHLGGQLRGPAGRKNQRVAVSIDEVREAILLIEPKP